MTFCTLSPSAHAGISRRLCPSRSWISRNSKQSTSEACAGSSACVHCAVNFHQLVQDLPERREHLLDAAQLHLVRLDELGDDHRRPLGAVCLPTAIYIACQAVIQSLGLRATPSHSLFSTSP